MSTLIWSLIFSTSTALFLYQLWGRWKLLMGVRTGDGRSYSFGTWGKRFKITIIYAFGQKKFFRADQPAGVLHAIIFWGFLILLLQVVTLFMRGWVMDFRIPGIENPVFARPYGFLKDFFEVAVLIAASIALYRWTITRPERLRGFVPAENQLRGSSHWEAYVILVFICAIMVTGLFYDAGRMVFVAAESTLEEMAWQPFSRALSFIFLGDHLVAQIVSEISWWTHNLVILCFLNLLPRSKHFHIITAIPNVFFGKIEPKGKLSKQDFSTETPFLGASLPNHFNWKQALDMFSCTECGRCSSVCPATSTGKPLAPRQFLINLRDTVYAHQQSIIYPKNSMKMDTVVGDGKPVIDDVIWSCVSCRACEEACPVNIEYVDKIVDIRQHLVQEAARFPSELNRTFKGLENNSNPWGIAREDRAAWAAGLSVPTFAENPSGDYLYYVGCGGSFDPNNKKVTQSFVKLLKQAGISFSILGRDESCNGETARRLGNEYLFQSMAEQLVSKIQSTGKKKILVNCPHCYNTLKNEYPDFGGHWEVTHAAAFVGNLVGEGKLQLNRPYGKKVVYHDSCYYGRFNDIYDEPRNLIKKIAGCKLLEMDRCKHNGMCCGAGGGRMWMEERKDQRVNILRTEQALEKNPDVIATSCPFCKIMIGSAINEKALGDKVAVMDVMEIVAQNALPNENKI